MNLKRYHVIGDHHRNSQGSWVKAIEAQDEIMRLEGKLKKVEKALNQKIEMCKVLQHNQTLRSYEELLKILKGEFEISNRCTCHERDSSFTCDVCKAEGTYGHMEEK